jgi:class 3 adenylate cyclase/tetratricopeptide (TPR) repeat protein
VHGGLSTSPVERGSSRDVRAAARAELASYLAPTHLEWLATEPDRGHRRLEGSLLFADVSGFTGLGERLARRGRIGAEQLTEAINAVFGAMVTAIGSAGGELIKFGGDAVLALFAGADHERRACSAAVAIQDALEAMRPLVGRGAESRLKVSAGVASGDVDLFLAGRSPRELIVAGPLASAVTSLEAVADAGEVLISARTLAALPSRCAGGPRGPGTLLVQPPPDRASPSPTPPPDADPLPGLALHLHDHEPADGEHRTVTVGFLQVRGTDELLEQRGPEALAAALDEIVGAVGEACHSWGVTLVSSDVDRGACKLILCAGAPTASTDDEDRILHAMLSITDREWPLPVRGGVNRGPAFTGDIGLAERRVWSVMGDAVNLAARVMANSEPGRLLATTATLAGVRDDFSRTEVEPFTVKGKSQPVRAEVVGGALGVARAAPSPDAPFVGRREELAILREAIAAARSGQSRIVEIVAEPGLGKSRLVQAIVDEVDDVNVIRILAGPYGVHTPYLAMRAPLRTLAGIDPEATDEQAALRLHDLVGEHAPRLERWLPLIARPFGLDRPPTPETAELLPEFARPRLHAALAHLLDLLLPERPTLTLIEDAHWLDDASAELLRHLLSASRQTGPRRGWGAGAEGDGSPAGQAAVITRRPVADGLQLDDLQATRIELEPLAVEDAQALVAGEGDDALSPAVRSEVLERADGNPLLLQELVAAVRAGRSVDDLPDSVEALMTARIDTLPRRERRLLRDAAVLGIHVPVEMLGELLGEEPEVMGATLEPLRGEFLVATDSDTLSFRHALLRSAAYNALSFKRRRALHARAGEAIERRAAGEEVEPELPAIHFHAAGRWRESWQYSRLAGERAMRNAAPVEAADFFSGALEASRYLRGLDRSERAAVAEALGDAAEFGGDYERARNAYARAAKLRAGEPLPVAELCLKQGRIAENTSHLSDALRWFTRGLSRLEPAPAVGEATAVRARLILAHGATRLRAGRLRDALPYLDEAAELATRSGDRATLAHAYYLLDWAHSDLQTADAERYRDLALPIYEELGDFAMQGRVLNNLGVNAFYESRWDEAVDYYERAREVGERAGDAVMSGTPLNNLAEIRIDQGRIDEAEELLRDALASWRAARYRAGIATALLNLGKIATRRGDFELAADLLARSREEIERMGSGAMIAELETWEAERLLLSGDVDAAAELLDRLSETAAAAGVPPATPAVIERLRGKVALARGDRERAVELLRRGAELGAQAAAQYSDAMATLELHALGKANEADADRAHEILRRMGVVDAPFAAD